MRFAVIYASARARTGHTFEAASKLEPEAARLALKPQCSRLRPQRGRKVFAFPGEGGQPRSPLGDSGQIFACLVSARERRPVERDLGCDFGAEFAVPRVAVLQLAFCGFESLGRALALSVELLLLGAEAHGGITSFSALVERERFDRRTLERAGRALRRSDCIGLTQRCLAVERAP